VEISPRSLASENYMVPGLSHGVVCVILRSAILVQCRLVTVKQTDWRTQDGSIYRGSI